MKDQLWFHQIQPKYTLTLGSNIEYMHYDFRLNSPTKHVPILEHQKYEVKFKFTFDLEVQGHFKVNDLIFLHFDGFING